MFKGILVSLLVATAFDPSIHDETRLNAERAADADVLSVLRRNGDCASLVRSINLQFIGPEANVVELSARATDLGFTVSQIVHTSDGETAIDLSVMSDTQPSSIDELTMTALRIEKHFDLRYDGWGTIVQKC